MPRIVGRTMGFNKESNVQYLTGLPMVKGKARGGPRDGITLEASRNWDGIVRHGPKNLTPYKGRYIWYRGYWVWKPNEEGNENGESTIGES